MSDRPDPDSSEEEIKQALSKLSRRVWFLGAGFSRPAGYPLMAEFRNAIQRRSDLRPEHSGAIGLINGLRSTLKPGQPEIANWDPDNFEHLASYAAYLDAVAPKRSSRLDSIKGLVAALYRAPTFLPDRGPTTNRYFLKNNKPVADALGKEPDFAFTADASTLLVASGLANPGRSPDTIITTNYDTHIETVLSHFGVPSDFGVTGPRANLSESKRRIASAGPTILKLHGSVDWAYDWGRGKLLGGDPIGVPPAIALPLLGKSIDPPFTQIWREAAFALFNATRLTFIGYSLPPSDAQIRFLLSSFVLGPDGDAPTDSKATDSLSVRIVLGSQSQSVTTEARLQETAKNYTSLFNPRLVHWGLSRVNGRAAPDADDFKTLQGLAEYRDVGRTVFDDFAELYE